MRFERKKDSYGPKEVTHRMILTNQMHRRLIEKKLEGTGVHRAQHRLLMSLADNHFVSQVELARHLEITPATIAVSLKSMEKDGLICRKVKGEDNRANFVELTEKGKRIAEESSEYFNSVDEQMYQGFSQEERKELSDYLDRVYDNMEQMAKTTDGGEKWDSIRNM
ncbi:MAG: MarR family winged helix-turn-helix transcriptional regulator [Eubacterium sp.]|nr:MarR family winged helix-turn-helix transcriptional regulator [Eubacterium sp.]